MHNTFISLFHVLKETKGKFLQSRYFENHSLTCSNDYMKSLNNYSIINIALLNNSLLNIFRDNY